MWRVAPEFNLIEPVLQKRTTSGWTGGRKVALKQLLPDGAQYPMMSPQDRKVAGHIREEVTSSWGGYVNRNYFVHPNALLSLVNHPLVFIEPEVERPAELAHGQVRLRAESVTIRSSSNWTRRIFPRYPSWPKKAIAGSCTASTGNRALSPKRLGLS